MVLRWEDGPASVVRTEWYPMPVLRYFVYVGGALLALLFVCDAVFPQVPLPETLKSGSDLPAVRIRSERQWPERVVIDTTLPASVPVTIAKAETPKLDSVNADAAQPVAAVTSAQQPKLRDAFAQMGAVHAKPQAVSPAKLADNDAAKSAGSTVLNSTDAVVSKTTNAVPEAKRPSKRKVAKVHSSRPMILVAQQPQPHGGWFDSTW